MKKMKAIKRRSVEAIFQVGKEEACCEGRAGEEKLASSVGPHASVCG